MVFGVRWFWLVLVLGFFLGGVSFSLGAGAGAAPRVPRPAGAAGEHGVLQPLASAQGVSACEGWISLLGFTRWKGGGEEFIR